MPSANTARKVTAATRANATIRVLKRSGVTAGCFCVVVSSAPAAAAVASAIDGGSRVIRQGGRWQTTSLPGVTVPLRAMSARTSFLPKLAHFCLLGAAAATAQRARLEMVDEASAAIPAQRIKLFTVVSACTLATAFLTVFALGAAYHPGPLVAPPTPAFVAPIDSAATPITSTKRAGKAAGLQRRTRRREGAPMWAGDPKKVLMAGKGKGKGAGKAGGKWQDGKKVGKILPLLERIRNKHKIAEVVELPQSSLEKHAAT